ncbi:MAG TPA: chromate transporter [Rhodoblastus sp.]|nr:chromate transporter [Rhodoblastus sp.]
MTDGQASRVLRTPSLLDMFLGWGWVGMMGFGGVTPWAHRMVVEKRGWLDDREYSALLGICQILPGPNTPNLCVVLGQRYAGLAGATVSILGLMTAPLLAIVAIGVAYDYLSGAQLVRIAVGGAASAVAGLVFAAGVKMARGARLDPVQVGICAAVFVAVGVFRAPLLLAVVIFGPLSVAFFHFRRKGGTES